jgi:hypothetical protein
MYQFADWADEIAAVSTLPEFQNAAVVIYTPGELGDYDPDTGEYEEGDATLLYSGRCRVVGLRSSRPGDAGYDPDALKSVRIQLPNVPVRIPNNAKAYFTDGGRNANLTTYVFNVNSDFNSSHVAAYTLELTVAMDITDADPPQFGD